MVEIDPRWAFYWRAKRGQLDGWDGPGAPFPGFWRFRYHARDIWRPCATWDDRGQVAASEGVPQPKDGPRQFIEVQASADRLWGVHFCWANWVSEDQYRHAVEHGEWWDTLRAAGAPHLVVTDVGRAEAIVPTLVARGGK